MTSIVNALLSVNVETVAEANGSDTWLAAFLNRFAAVMDQLFDPMGGWIFWLLLGMFFGGQLFNLGHHIEERLRDEEGGPPLWYLRLLARFVRLGIKYRWLTVRNSDLDAGLQKLATALPQKYGLAPLPADNFGAKQKRLQKTSEYLRMIGPLLNEKDIHHAKRISHALEIGKDG